MTDNRSADQQCKGVGSYPIGMALYPDGFGVAGRCYACLREFTRAEFDTRHEYGIAVEAVPPHAPCETCIGRGFYSRHFEATEGSPEWDADDQPCPDCNPDDNRGPAP